MEARAGLGSRTVVAVDVERRRFWVRLRAKLRSGCGVLKLMAPWRFLRGAGGEDERSTTAGCPRCSVHRRWGLLPPVPVARGRGRIGIGIGIGGGDWD